LTARACIAQQRCAGKIYNQVKSEKHSGACVQTQQDNRDYWNKNLRMTGLLLSIWFLVTYVVIYYARDLSFTFFNWPFSFWMGAQGALLIYLALIAFYASYMNKLDSQSTESTDNNEQRGPDQ
jgi:putative solute:sodium symporter small subunit